MPAPEIRLAVDADVDALVSLNEEIQTLHVAGAPSRYRRSEPDEIAAWFSSRIAEGAVWICRISGTAAGYLCVNLDARPPTPFSPARRLLLVDQVTVHSRFRRTGVGRALMTHAATLAQQLGCQRVELDVVAFNTEAIAFYSALGFSPVRHRLGRDVDRDS